MTVFGKPNFGDPTLFEKKHEVLGYYVQKWKTGDYGMFQPEYAILPQVRTTFIRYKLSFNLYWQISEASARPIDGKLIQPKCMGTYSVFCKFGG